MHGVHVMRQMAAVLQFLGKSHEAAVLCGAATSLEEKLALTNDTNATRDFRDIIEAVQNELTKEDFKRAWANGASLSVDELIDYVTHLHLPR